MRAFEEELPEAPRLLPPPGEATPQVKPTDKDGGPLEMLSTCRWCGGMHPTACPYIKIAEWHSTGQIARVVLKERPELEKAILYPYEEEGEDLRLALVEIISAKSLTSARQMAARLLKVMDGEKPV